MGIWTGFYFFPDTGCLYFLYKKTDKLNEMLYRTHLQEQPQNGRKHVT